jgi:hypothetical protein
MKYGAKISVAHHEEVQVLCYASQALGQLHRLLKSRKVNDGALNSDYRFRDARDNLAGDQRSCNRHA